MTLNAKHCSKKGKDMEQGGTCPNYEVSIHSGRGNKVQVESFYQVTKQSLKVKKQNKTMTFKF